MENLFRGMLCHTRFEPHIEIGTRGSEMLVTSPPVHPAFSDCDNAR
jgi:hypothetical protein